MPRHPWCASASASPTTAPTSTAGAGSPACAPCRACSRTRSRTLFRRTGEAPRLTVAGRTDAGVHALGQVAHLDVGEAALTSVARPRRGRDEDASPEATLARRLNGIIGADADVVVTHAERAPAGFDARFSAIWRRYEYRVADASATRDPLRATAHARRPARARCRGHGCGGGIARGPARLRRVLPAARGRDDDPHAAVLSMGAGRRRRARRVAAGRRVLPHDGARAGRAPAWPWGTGRLDAADPAALLRAAERTSAFTVMPAKGLVLTEVGYPDDHELEARAAQTRARRELHVGGHRRLSFPFGAAACAGTRR